MLKTKINNELKEIHELYKKNSGGTLDYIGEAYQYINGELKHTFSAGYDVNCLLILSDTTITGIETGTYYAYFAKTVIPDAQVGDMVCLQKGNNIYSLCVMKIDNTYVYIENPEV